MRESKKAPKRKTSASDDLDRMVAGHRREIRDFDALLAWELAELDLSLTIAGARRVRHLSQRELARRAGVTQAMIARLESPRNVSATLKTLAAVAAALGCRLRIALEAECPGRHAGADEESEAGG